jgi:tetratricopeptide (TPR) repeat protein
MAPEIQLDTLEAKGLIRLVASRPELEYLFRHGLVQDAAYGSLLKQERRVLHAQVGEALETLYPERRTELAAVLALHFEQAGDTDRAVRYYVEAGEFGKRRNAISEAFAAYSRAAALLSQQGAAASPQDAAASEEQARRLRVEIGSGRAEVGFSFMPTEELLADLELVIADAEALGDPELIVRPHLLSALTRLQSGESPAEPLVKRSLDRIAEIGETQGDPSLRAMPLALVGMNQVFAGSVRDGVRALEEAVPLLDRRQDSIGAAFARGALAMGYATLGEFAKAEEAARHAGEVAARGDLIAQLDALISTSMVQSARGLLDDAVPLAEACVKRAEETGATACLMASAWVLGDAYHRQGRYAEASEVLRRGESISGVVDRKVWRPTLQAWLGTSALALGEAAGWDWDEALGTARSIGNRLGEAGILAKRGEASAGRGRLEEALPDFAAAAALMEEMGARPGLARVLQGWAMTLRAAGRAEEANPVLRRSLALFEELGLEAEAQVVRTVLALGAQGLAIE